jgi:hypothetical protein
LGLGLIVQGLRSRVARIGFWVKSSGFKVTRLEFKNQGSGFRVQGSRFRVIEGWEFRIQGLVWGVGFRV